ncbi:MAG: glutamate--tRNA ligase family protein [Solirubrobacterales bacterium]
MTDPASPAVRVRFAPSPTGPLHVGSVRTALLNWLFARSSGGTVLLRIDDTDAERSSAELEASILADLEWIGLHWDEGPVRQSQRTARYAELLDELPTTDRDGAYEFGGRVIARADRSALYNLATAIDDVDDRITHVLRGRDHLANTQLQSEIIAALGFEPPAYVHAPLLTGADGTKLSKRSGGVDESGKGLPITVAALRDEGFPPTAIANALALSLADFGTDEVMLTIEQISQRFDLAHLHTADSQFDVDKLRWISGQHIRAMGDQELEATLRSVVDDTAPSAASLPDPLPPAALAAARTGGVTFAECAATAIWLFDPPPPDQAAAALLSAPETATAAAALVQLLPAPPVDLAAAETAFADLKQSLRDQGVKLGPALHGLRAVLTGRVEGPEFPYVLASLSVQRLDAVREVAAAAG